MHHIIHHIFSNQISSSLDTQVLTVRLGGLVAELDEARVVLSEGHAGGVMPPLPCQQQLPVAARCGHHLRDLWSKQQGRHIFSFFEVSYSIKASAEFVLHMSGV